MCWNAEREQKRFCMYVRIFEVRESRLFFKQNNNTRVDLASIGELVLNGRGVGGMWAVPVTEVRTHRAHNEVDLH